MALVPSPDLATSLEEGVVTYDTDSKRFSCGVCAVPYLAGPDVETHITGGKHKDVAAKYALAHVNDAPASLLNLLGAEEKNAAVSGTIEVTGTKQIECLVCHVTLSGLVPLRTHLVSRVHKNKTDLASTKQLVIPQKDNIAVRSSIVPGRRDATPAISSPLFDAEILSYDDGLKRYSCRVCEMPMSGNLDIEKHLVGAKHREAAARYAVAHPTTAPSTVLEMLNQDEIEAARTNVIRVTATKDFACTLCQVTLSGLMPLRSHIASNAHKRKSDILPNMYHPSTPQAASSTAVPSCLVGTSSVPPRLELSEQEKQQIGPILRGLPSELSRPGALPDLQRDKRLCSTNPQDEIELEKALREKIILQTDNLAEPYYCPPCDKKFNSSQPLKDHLKSNKHKKKAADFEYKKSFDNSNADKAQPVTPSIREELPLPKTKQPYTVLSMPRGHVYVFNYAFIGQRSRRKWSERDPENIQDTFRKMGYDVFLLENLTQEGTLKAFKDIRINSKLNSIDVLVIFILSHGVDPYTFKTEDGKKINLLEIRFSFSDQQCPYMRGKPKIFFTNYCRGDQMELHETDEKDVPNDMVTIHAATEGIMALRQKDVGTIFVNSLCEVLNRHAHDTELREIYLMLKVEMQQSRGTKPMWEDYGFRKFYFGPLNVITCNTDQSLPSHSNASLPLPQEIPTNMCSNSYNPDHDLNLGTCMRYNLTSNPRGHVYVFNNMFKEAVDFNYREGAEVDSENIKNTFTQLGYKVILKENLSAQRTYNALNDIRNDQTLNTVDSLIIFFLSHGDRPFIFRGEDDEELNLKKIRRMFLNSRCPQLKGKPKLFFTNFCRGVHDQMEIEYDSVREVLTDTITIHASAEGIQAKRHPKIGTLFVYSLCNVLRTHATRSNLSEIYTMVTIETQSLRGTQPVQEVDGFREFYF